MKTIYKYELQPRTELELPYAAQVLSVNTQNDQIYLWALIDTEQKVKVRRTFKVFGTGWDMKSDMELDFIGTVLLQNGRLVFHIFEETL